MSGIDIDRRSIKFPSIGRESPERGNAMKTIIITGASAGIGKAAARLFAENGWRVAATMRSPEREEDLGSLQNIDLYALDLTWNEERIRETIDTIVGDLGGLDVLVNNAGIGVFGAFESASQELIERQFNTNVFGLMRVTRAVLPHLRRNRKGSIVNVSSAVGQIALPMQSLYNSTKFAIEGLSESLQYELRPLGIRVKVVEPGNVKTDFFKSLTVAKDPSIGDYEAYQDQVIANHFKLDDRGSSPESIASIVYRAALDQSDKLRFVAGRDASIFLKIRKLLPDWLFFKIVRSQVEGKKKSKTVASPQTTPAT